MSAHARRARPHGVLIVPLLVVALAGCGHNETLSDSATATATTTATPAPITLTWRVAAPASRASSAPSAYIVAPSDGRVAYGCGSAGGAGAMRPVIWSTQDSGRTWSNSAPLPYVGLFSECVLIVDANDPQRVAVWINTAKMGASPQASNVVAYLSQDGGLTWRTLSKTGPYLMMSMSSYEGAIYASGSGISASGADLRDVWVSHDSGVSWRALGATPLSPNPYIWINPQTGEMLGTNNYDLIPTLWRSANGGSSWTKLSVPDVVGAGGEQSLLVAPHEAGWRICVTGSTAPGPKAKNLLACSADLGATWTSPTALNPSQYSPKGFTFTAPVDVFAITDDGALLASYDDIQSGLRFEALTPGAHAWAPLSPPPVASATGGPPVYTTGPGNGMLWVPGGDITHPFATATYP